MSDKNIYYGKVTVRFLKYKKQQVIKLDMVYTTHNEGMNFLKDRCARIVHKSKEEIEVIVHDDFRKIIGTRNT